jgi:dihydrolipoamide dehydrogenase
VYDAVIIGGGPGGYSCAIRAAQLGGKICLIEKGGLGGTCTQRGCIPTKFLHTAGDIIRRANHSKKNGIDISIKLDYKILKSRMQATVDKLAEGIRLLLENNGVDLIQGTAGISAQNKVLVNGKEIEAKHIVIATGTHPVCIRGYEFDGNVLSTGTILDLDELPKTITVVGGGYSGCEFAAILNAFGCRVSLIEAEEHLLPAQPAEIGMVIEKYMRMDGINIMTKTKVERITDKAVIADGQKIESEKILVSIGRHPNINPDELNRIGIKFDKNGIVVNEKMETTVPGIFAIGDVTGVYELAHVAAKQGEIAAQNLMGIKSKIDYSAVPACVFTYPELAFVGKFEGKKGEFPLAASAKASCLGETRGMIKVFENDGVLVGAVIIAPHAGELIGEAALAIKMRLKPQDVFDTIHAHPTLPESFVDALRDIDGTAIHLPKKNA